MFAEIQPSLLFFILWALLSWFSSKKKKTNLSNDDKQNKFGIEDPQNIIEGHSEVYVDELYDKMDELNYDFEVQETVEKNSVSNLNQAEKIINHPIKDDLYSDSKIKTVDRENYKLSSIKRILYNKSKLKKIIILNEIMMKPRALNPYD